MDEFYRSDIPIKGDRDSLSSIKESRDQEDPTILEVSEEHAESMRTAGDTLYGKIPNVLTSYILELQSRDAWCKERSWEAFPEGKV